MSLYRKLGVAATAVLIGQSSVFGQEIEIKGLRLGMTLEDVQQKVGLIPFRDFTIAGVPSKHSKVYPNFHEGKLDDFMFFFDASSFDEVKEAVKSKYPALKCQDSTVTNAMGAAFTQTECELRDKQGSLRMSRFVSDLRTSLIGLVSDRAVKELMDQRREKRKDL